MKTTTNMVKFEPEHIQNMAIITTFDTRVESHNVVNKKVRYTQIIEILENSTECLSAKDIAVEMCKRGYTPTNERNFAAPRITELIKTGVLDVIGKKKCDYTGKTVAIFKLLNK